MEFQNLLYTVENNIAVVIVNRPDKMNALNHDTLIELKNIFAQIKKDPAISVVILTGAGEKAFVAGADITELNGLNKESAKAFAEFGQEVFNSIENLGKPVIAAVNGYALGGGCELALSCHLRVASTNAKFGQPEIKLGIIPGYGGTQRLTRLINTGRSVEYILTGDMITADDALKIGLVNHVYDTAELMPNAKKIAGKIASFSQVILSNALESILAANNTTLEQGLAAEVKLFSACCDTEDFKEGTSAFLQKRAPHFQNK